MIVVLQKIIYDKEIYDINNIFNYSELYNQNIDESLLNLNSIQNKITTN